MYKSLQIFRCQCRPLFFICIWMLLSAPCSAENANSISPNCSSPKTPAMAFFQGLKGINLIVHLPPNYQGVLDCEGKEAQCLKSQGAPPAEIESLVKNYKLLIARYPSVLRPEVIYKRVGQRIEDFWSPFLVADENCNVAKVSFPILENKDKATRAEKLRGYVENKDYLTVTIKIDFDESITPRLAILSRSIYRPGAEGGYLKMGYSNQITAIDLSKEIANIEADVEKFINRAIEPLTIIPN